MWQNLKAVTLIVGWMFLSGCGSVLGVDKNVEWEYIQPDSYPVLYAVGYAPIQAQPGSDKGERMLRAIRASKLDAYRELAEQVYGQQLSSDSTIGDMLLRDDNLQASVSGVIRGARVVRSYPMGDTYATELELDMRDVYRLYLINAKPRRIKDVQYY